MPRQSTHPPIIDSLIRISLKDLIEQELFCSYRGIRSATISFYRENVYTYEQCATMLIRVSKQGVNNYVEFNYLYNGKEINYQIPLVAKRSNLGKGLVWFFKCPDANKVCKKLYLYHGRFVHRNLVKGGFYAAELAPKKWRKYHNYINRGRRLRSIIEQSQYKNYIPTYDGIPTKKGIQVGQAVEELAKFHFGDPGYLLPI